ncbi:hypothetical protein COV19_01410 [Candidatus Woesearchaeota archaeon CG10_big_fil_rev_8_21_14_0_10_44_13]|nr:MAG: hypothetical protein COV19_01410 [Candidatus Woesearchaeota archaeon CG10_big_fil_rev_8_21_14_0_10_44_13]
MFVAAGCRSNTVTGNVVAEKDSAAPVQSAQKPAAQTEQPAPATDDSIYAVECKQDSDCGETVYGERYCFQNGVVTPLTKNICVNPGSIKSYCKREMADEVLMCASGKEVCRKGECYVLANLPCTDSDGGKNYDVAGTVVDAEMLEYKDYCIDKYQIMEYFCPSTNKGLVLKEPKICTGGKCITGACVD